MPTPRVQAPAHFSQKWGKLSGSDRGEAPQGLTSPTIFMWPDPAASAAGRRAQSVSNLDEGAGSCTSIRASSPADSGLADCMVAREEAAVLTGAPY